MYIAYIQMIDGLQIVTGVDKKQIDQEETKKIVKDLLLETSEFKSVISIFDKIKSYKQLNNKLLKNEYEIYKSVTIEKNIAEISDSDLNSQQKKLVNDYRTGRDFNFSQIKDLKVQLETLDKNLKLKQKELLLTNAVYQETAYNQIDLSENQYDDFKIKLINIRGKNQFLLSDGNIIDDNRKKIYWLKNEKWEKRIIQFLTDIIDPAEILESELTTEQRNEIIVQLEKDRIAALTLTEKEEEKNNVLAGLLREASIMKSELEILEDPDALQKSQDWYNTEVLKVEEKYG